MRLTAFILFGSLLLPAQSGVTIRVNAADSVGPFKPVYRYFGYDEPNYTYANNGRKLLGEMAAVSREPVYVRTHFLLATGDGAPGFKWGSTNAYTENASRQAVYDWTIVDRILTTYLEAGAKPFMEIGFMPEALSSKPEPYHPVWIPGAKNEQYYIGWTYPPKDYAKWAELIHAWVEHAVSKYGRGEVESWYWEVWNEPNIGYWHGTPEEYDKLYDATVAAVKQVLPGARVGGPASTGPGNAKAADFLRQFLQHCSDRGVPLDFISYHAKGRPDFVDGHVRMGIAQEMQDAQRGFEIVRSFAKFRQLPIVLSEADPEGCAACSARVYPPNAYRNGTLYPTYTAAAMKTLIQMAERAQVNLEGTLTWAFEFENQPYFDGFRTLATNGVDKPVLNVFRMAAMLRGDVVRSESSGAVPIDAMMSSGVRSGPDVDALATRMGRNVAILVWNYQDDDVAGEAAQVALEISGLPRDGGRVLVHHYRIDGEHSNAYSVWKQMGSPQQPSAGQYLKLEAAGQLGMIGSPYWMDSRAGVAEVQFALPLQGVSLVQLDF